MDTTPAGARLTAVCVVHEIAPVSGGKPGELTAIDKRQVTGPVDVGPLGLAGDAQCATEFHGGPPKALYAYSDEDAAWWADHLGREITPGLFGENLRTSGLDIGGAEIGERWQLGEPGSGVLVEVTYPREPCMTFQRRMGEPHWVRRFTERGAMGTYLRVVVPGRVAAGDQVRVTTRPGHGVRVVDVFPTMSAASARALLDAADVGLVAVEHQLLEAAGRATARG